ncbi:MAG: gephyrin-like molybdotransferase Glp [Pirellulales bacterium]
MLSVDEALQHVLAQARCRPAADCPIRDALGLVLAEDVTSDVDSPPHDKSVVDGYAVMAADLADGQADFDVLEEVTAGAVPHRAVTRGTSVLVMTGAPIPDGADAVVMIEQAEPIDGRGQGGRVRLRVQRVAAGQNIMRRAASMARGDRVLSVGHELRAIEIGMLAEVGRAHVRAVPRPTLAVLATGNELVPVSVVPEAGQIRNSNGPMLAAAARSAGAIGIDLGIARDEPQELTKTIAYGLTFDVLVVSGGVSAGVLDLVPGVLESLGVRQVFHKVSIKPGKPLWFGVLAGESDDRLVFGLPGNPVSSLVGFELFVRPAIARLAGRATGALEETSAKLAVEHAHRGNRPTYHPARLAIVDGQPTVEPVGWQGSGDLTALACANALACFPAGDRTYPAGETIRVLRLPNVT